MVDQQRTARQRLAPTQARRVSAAVLDAVVALLCGLAAGAAAGVEVADGVVELRPGSPTVWGAALGTAVGLSFLNHVLLTYAVRASLGKLLTGLRVVRAADGRRPDFFRLIAR
ncbi:RDD family protein, partial [Streptomyces sp. SID11233]|nr:RDD family protein [Streptomyces sp. SID11233]